MPRRAAERKDGTMTDHIEDLKGAIIGGLVHELEKVVTKNRDDARAIETNRPGGIDIGKGANWIAPTPSGRPVIVGGAPIAPYEEFMIDACRRDADSLEEVIEAVKTGKLKSNQSAMAKARNRRNKIVEERDVLMAQYKSVPVEDRTEEGLHESRLPMRIAFTMIRLADAERAICLIDEYGGFHDEAGDAHPPAKARKKAKKAA